MGNIALGEWTAQDGLLKTGGCLRGEETWIAGLGIATEIMDHGDFCAPAHKPRQVEIDFECSAKPALISVQETQVCSYTARMQTPAACHALS
eukprot:symbB.v1.2.024297.t1/scaffold2289.1/size83295/5